MSLYQYKHLAVPDFLSREAPPNYIAGLGRGATGFTTRSDIGPARESTSFGRPSGSNEPADPMLSAFNGTAPALNNQAADQTADKDDDDERFQDPENETGLFNTAPYEADDEEADKIYEAIDKKMEERAKARREAREAEEMEKLKKEKPVVQEQFADLKRQLGSVTEDEWANIPDVGDLVRRNKRQKQERANQRFYAVSDTIIQMGMNQTSDSLASAVVDPVNGFKTPAINPGIASTVPGDGTVTDFVQFGQARDKVLSLKLDQVSDSVSGQTTIDPKGYLTDLSSLNIKSDAEISDIKKARTLLKSVITTNPKHAPGWIAAARLEEVAGKMVAARELVARGCEECPKNEDVWIEAARLNTPENAKIILANAIRQIPQSVKIWLKACSLETDTKSKKKVLRRALEFLPNSVKLWKSAVSLEEDPEDARILLSRAVECVPLSEELWLALARLETYENAKKVLNRARAHIPTSHDIWLTAAKLEDQNKNEKMVDMIVNRAIQALAAKGTTLSREQWIKCAQEAEAEGHLLTCQAIIRHTIGLGVEEEDQKHTWLDDADTCIAQKSIATARAIFAHALKVFPTKKSVWRQAAFFEKEHGTRESLEELLQRAVTYCPQAEVLWLMGAKEKWLAGDLDAARTILAEAFRANPNSEQIWLAAIKLETETGQYERAQILLKKAREQAGTDRVWMKSAVLERLLGNVSEALSLLEEAIKKFPAFAKLYMIKGQIEEGEQQNVAAARETFAKGSKTCPKSVPLWILAAQLEEKQNLLIKARAVLEKARIINPKEDLLWLESIRLEARHNNTAMTKALMAKALQECPTSGLLWSEAIVMEARPQRKARSADALKKCENDPYVVCTIARLFWHERKLDKARTWLNKAVSINPDLGDLWAWLLKFELQHGSKEQVEDVIKRCVAAEPKHGMVWTRVRKDLKNIKLTSEQVLQTVAGELQEKLL